MDRDVLDKRLLHAHERHDLPELVKLYSLAAEKADREKDDTAACFYLTHAFVFALESGAPEALHLNESLAERGRAKRLEF